MTINEFRHALKKLMAAFPGQIKADTGTYEAWFDVVLDLPTANIERAIQLIAREREQIFPGTNLGAVIRNLATPTITEATVSAHLNRAIEIHRSPDGNPYKYLRDIAPRLLEMAESADIFNGQLPADKVGFLVRDVAKQFVEEKRNREKGFRAPAIPQSRQLPAPTTIGQLNDEQRAANLARIRTIRQTLSGEAQVDANS